MTNETISSDSLDINDAFDSIALAEVSITTSGFKEGYEQGKRVGEFEGYHLGYHRGAEIGSEVGFYKGFLSAFTNAVSDTPHQYNDIVEKLSRLIDTFPRCNDETKDIVLIRDQIRSLFKRLCSVMKIDPNIGVPSDSTLSF